MNWSPTLPWQESPRSDLPLPGSSYGNHTARVVDERGGVKFHSVDPFTPADAKFSLERTYDPNMKTMVATVFTTIERIEEPDPSTLVIHTRRPDPLLPARLVFYRGQIVRKKYVVLVSNDTFNPKHLPWLPVIQPYEDYSAEVRRLHAQSEPTVRGPSLQFQVSPHLGIGALPTAQPHRHGLRSRSLPEEGSETDEKAEHRLNHAVAMGW